MKAPMLVCTVCKQKYKPEEEGPDDAEHAICVGCITTLYHGTSLVPSLSIRPISLQDFRKRMKEVKQAGRKKRVKLVTTICTRKGDHRCGINGPCNGYPRKVKVTV